MPSPELLTDRYLLLSCIDWNIAASPDVVMFQPLLLFIVSGLGKTKMGGVIKEILPMVLIMIVLLFLCTYIPNIIMFIPNAMVK